jgi:hypothetical protein
MLTTLGPPRWLEKLDFGPPSFIPAPKKEYMLFWAFSKVRIYGAAPKTFAKALRLCVMDSRQIVKLFERYVK